MLTLCRLASATMRTATGATQRNCDCSRHHMDSKSWWMVGLVSKATKYEVRPLFGVCLLIVLLDLPSPGLPLRHFRRLGGIA